MKPVRFTGLLCLATSLAAQSYLSSPAGYLTTESSGSLVSSSHPFYSANTRFQYLDASNHGTPKTFQALEIRRDGGATYTMPARTVNVALIMAHTNLATATTTFASNYSGSPTTVIAKKSFNLPDLTTLPPAQPAPWGQIVFPFDSGSFFAYDGVQDLLFEFQCDGVSPVSSFYSPDTVDAATVPGNGTGSYINSTDACLTPGNTSKFWIYFQAPTTDSGNNSSLKNYALRGVPNSAGVWAIGLSDLNLGGLFCATLHSSCEVLIPVTFDATGNLGSSTAPQTLTFPYPGNFTAVTQFACLDVSQTPQPLALSDAAKNNVVAYAPAMTARISTTSTTTPPSGLLTGTRSGLYSLIARLTY